MKEKFPLRMERSSIPPYFPNDSGAFAVQHLFREKNQSVCRAPQPVRAGRKRKAASYHTLLV